MTVRRPFILEVLVTLIDEDQGRDVQVLLSPFSYHSVRCHCVLLLVYMSCEITECGNPDHCSATHSNRDVVTVLESH